MSLAADKGLRVDIHCDETDDDHSRFVEVMAAETIRLGMGGRVTASHTTAMHSYNAAYAYRLINNLKRAQMHMVTNPLDNSVLQGRFDGYPIRRGHTRVKALLAAGGNVCVGPDSVITAGTWFRSSLATFALRPGSRRSARRRQWPGSAR